MSREAVKRVAFLGKAPSNRNDLHWILQLADRLIDRREEVPELMPANVIPFPETLRRESDFLGNSMP